MEQPGDGTGHNTGRNEVNADSAELVVQARSISVEGDFYAGGRKRTRPIPRQLPGPWPYFSDREEPLEIVERAWRRAVESGTTLVVVYTGPAGIGKSELAARTFQAMAPDVPGPHLHADMNDGGPRTAADVLGDFLGALGVEPDDVPASVGEMTGLYRSLTSDRAVIVSLDDVSLASQVRPLVPNSPGGIVVATARAMPGNLRGAVEVPVEPMDDDVAVRLLEDVAGRSFGEPERAEAAAVARLCGGSPLLLCSAGRRLGRRRPATLHTEIVREAEGAAVFDSAYDALSDPAQALYRRLAGLLGRTFSAELAAVAGGVDAPLPALRELERAGLLDDLGDGRFRIHGLVHEHARGRCAPDEREAALSRVLTWYLRKAVEADHALMPGRWRLGPDYEPLRGLPPTLPDDAAREWLEDNRPVLRAAVRAAAERGRDDLVVRLVEAQWALCFTRKHYEHWIDVHRLGVAAAPNASDPRFRGRMHCQLGFAYAELGRADDAAAEFEAALGADREIGHVRGEATAVESLGLLALRRSGAEEPSLETSDREQAERAHELLTDNLRLNLRMSESDDDRAVALAWRHLGRASSARGDHAEAAGQLARAAELLAALPDPYNEGKTLTDLGRARLRAGRPGAASDPLRRALDLLGEREFPAERAAVLLTLGVAAARDGDRGAAVEWGTDALRILESRNDPRTETARTWLADLTRTGKSDS
ncbi:tetratricopeptide repeat protein [Actinomadura sp. CNU-125]|uniref:tetratricopeptide repeat protein n=1 Tax=Actinomadura sp. CNU-125 TaxID=1904961 RepID=UPI00096A5318|nr:tetratricopeptide repeat protein [Actinomadura sp. CNU-125]